MEKECEQAKAEKTLVFIRRLQRDLESSRNVEREQKKDIIDLQKRNDELSAELSQSVTKSHSPTVECRKCSEFTKQSEDYMELQRKYKELAVSHSTCSSKVHSPVVENKCGDFKDESEQHSLLNKQMQELMKEKEAHALLISQFQALLSKATAVEQSRLTELNAIQAQLPTLGLSTDEETTRAHAATGDEDLNGSALLSPTESNNLMLENDKLKEEIAALKDELKEIGLKLDEALAFKMQYKEELDAHIREKDQLASTTSKHKDELLIAQRKVFEDDLNDERLKKEKKYVENEQLCAENKLLRQRLSGLLARQSQMHQQRSCSIPEQPTSKDESVYPMHQSATYPQDLNSFQGQAPSPNNRNQTYQRQASGYVHQSPPPVSQVAPYFQNTHHTSQSVQSYDSQPYQQDYLKNSHQVSHGPRQLQTTYQPSQLVQQPQNQHQVSQGSHAQMNTHQPAIHSHLRSPPPRQEQPEPPRKIGFGPVTRPIVPTQTIHHSPPREFLHQPQGAQVSLQNARMRAQYPPSQMEFPLSHYNGGGHVRTDGEIPARGYSEKASNIPQCKEQR